eukprot:Hpha_TRINITY_DN12330_c0_g1::TRINITY_DN12330_c0_g1_i1::g.156041::m.156041
MGITGGKDRREPPRAARGAAARGAAARGAAGGAAPGHPPRGSFSAPPAPAPAASTRTSLNQKDRLTAIWKLLGGREAVSEDVLDGILQSVQSGRHTWENAETALFSIALGSSTAAAPAPPAPPPLSVVSTSDDDADECISCMERPRATIWKGCGHSLYCEICADHIARRTPQGAGCPYCATNEEASPLSGPPVGTLRRL